MSALRQAFMTALVRVGLIERAAPPNSHAKIRRDLETAIKVARRSRRQRLAASGNVIDDLARGIDERKERERP